ncbi:MAG TPA: ornithine cyclodeaminase family protein [Terracidiphilus sp.]|nr:ornithine cyclodeaminase family protein [Terracidiphilus sp.]
MYISENEVRAALTYEALIPAVREALIDYSAGKVVQPARMIMRAGVAEDHRDGWFAVMPVIHGDAMGVKTVTFYRRNAERGLHTHMAIVELLNRATGEPLAVMDGRAITEMRTAAVTAVGYAALAPLHFETPPRSLGILGSGVQAKAHIEALRVVWPEMNEIRIWSPTTAHAQRLADATGARAVPIEEAAAAEVVLTVTTAVGPVLKGRWLAPNALVLGVGATGDGARELDDEVMHTSYLVAESRDCVGRESGDVRGSGATIEAEIGEVLAGVGTGSVPRDRRVVYKTVGMAIEDLAAARVVWNARR